MEKHEARDRNKGIERERQSNMIEVTQCGGCARKII